MHNIVTVSRRVLLQFRHDPRTLAVMFLAPCIVLWLFSVLLGSGDYTPRLASVDLPTEVTSALQKENVEVIETTNSQADKLLETQKADAKLTLNDGTLTVKVEGANASLTGATIREVSAAMVGVQREGKAKAEAQLKSISFEVPQENLEQLPEPIRQKVQENIDKTISEKKAELPTLDDFMSVSEVDVTYLHGDKDWTSFDFFGPVFIGIFIFVFVFITSSMSLLVERSGGTVDRLNATPVKGWHIVGGYVVGFGLVALMQSAVILWASISLIDFPNEGNIFVVVFLTVSMALVSLTLGLLVSSLAHTPFQVIQLMIVFVTPQILLSGIFDLTMTPTWMQVIGRTMPIYWGADALREVMLRGASFGDITVQVSVVWAFIIGFFLLASLNFRKVHAKIPQGQA